MSGYFVVTHNGYDTQYFDTPAEVEKFINDTLEAHKDIKPRQIFRANGEDNRTEEPLSTITRVLNERRNTRT